MAWRRACGAVIMVLGASAILATVAGATVLTVSILKSSDIPATPVALAAIATAGIAGGVLTMLLGRLVYGEWRDAAPIANFTGDVARMIGLSVAFGLGAMLAFLLVTGLEEEDVMAALVLGLGTAAGLVLAYLGGNIRGRGRRYLD